MSERKTISLAMNDSPRVATATVERVRAAARRIGYRNDPGLARLAELRWSDRRKPVEPTLALVMEQQRPDLAEAAIARAAALGYRCEWFDPARFPSPESLARMLRARGIRGLLVRFRPEDRVMAEFPLAGFLSVAFGEGDDRPVRMVVRYNRHQMMADAWAHLWDAGARRIGALLWPLTTRGDWMEHDSFRRCQTLYGAEAIPPIFIDHRHDEKEVERIHAKNHTDAWITVRATQAEQIHRITGIDRHRIVTRTVEPHESREARRFPRHRMPVRRLAVRAVDMLDTLLRHRDKEPSPDGEHEALVLTPEWTIPDCGRPTADA
ncbi:MAG: hypothetical protein ACOCZU_09010 [Planctomycetota bacterium]